MDDANRLVLQVQNATPPFTVQEIVLGYIPYFRHFLNPRLHFFFGVHLHLDDRPRRYPYTLCLTFCYRVIFHDHYLLMPLPRSEADRLVLLIAPR